MQMAACSQVREYRKAYNRLNMAIADYWTTAQACGTSMSILDRGGFSGAAGVRYMGVVAEAAGTAGGKGYAYSQYKFGLGPMPWAERQWYAGVISNGSPHRRRRMRPRVG